MPFYTNSTVLLNIITLVIFVQVLVLFSLAPTFLLEPQSVDTPPAYTVFYISGQMAQEGAAHLAYNRFEIASRCLAIFPNANINQIEGFFYPPAYFFITELAAQLDFTTSFILWIACTGVFFLLVLRPFVKNMDEWWFILAAPPIWANILYGMDAFLTAGLLIIAYRYLFTRQVVAGIAIGLLCLNPHFALLLPLVLLAYQRWTAILCAAITVALLVLASVDRYGIEPWYIYFNDMMNYLPQAIAQGDQHWDKISSVYVQAMFFWLPPNLAMGLQIVFTFCVAACFIAMVYMRVPYPLVMAFLLAAAIPSTPYNYHYDWVILIAPMLLLWREIEKTKYYGNEKEAMIALFACSLVMFFDIPLLEGSSFGFFFIFLLLNAIAIRAFTFDEDRARKILPQRHPWKYRI